MAGIMVIIVINASVAQLELERHASNVEVAGSSPARGANFPVVQTRTPVIETGDAGETPAWGSNDTIVSISEL